MKLLCFGDSNTYGWDPRSYLGGRYGEQVRWPALLGALPGVEVTERGENGRCIPHREYQLRGALAELTRGGKVDIIMIMLGGNDLLTEPDFFAEDVAERMEDFLLYLRGSAGLAGVEYLLIAPPPMRRGQWVTEPRLLYESARLPELYAQLASDLKLRYLAAPSAEGALANDGVHLTETGHRLLFEAVKGLITA